MAHDRYVLLGLGRARAEWFGKVASWATSGSLPADFSKCVSVGEVRQRLNGLQPHSALLVEAGITGLDRDLLDIATRANVPVFVIDSVTDRSAQWIELGAAVVLPLDVTPADLLYALSNHAQVISRIAENAAQIIEDAVTATGTLIAVCGPGGTGVSTVAIELAQGFGDDVLQTELVVLADFARNGEQAMLHDTHDVMPGVEELVEASRTRVPAIDDIRDLTFHISARRYRLLLGQRRSFAWTSMPPRAVEEGIRALRRSFRTVIADITADFESERDGGSSDIEERNALARTTVLNADIVLVVGLPGMKGTHACARTIRDLLNQGIAAERIMPVVNQAPKDSRSRNEIVNAITQLVQPVGQKVTLGSVIFVPEGATDTVLRDGSRMPKKIVDGVIGPVRAALSNTGLLNVSEQEPVAVKPGELGILDEAS